MDCEDVGVCVGILWGDWEEEELEEASALAEAQREGCEEAEGEGVWACEELAWTLAVLAAVVA